MEKTQKKTVKKRRLKLKVKIALAIMPLIAIIPFSYAIFKNITNSSSQLVSAIWSVSLDQSEEDNYLSIIPGSNEANANYRVNITSESEVDVVYSIVVDDLPTGVSISLDGGAFVAATNNKVIFSDVGTIGYNAVNKTVSHILTFSASNVASFVDEEEINVNVIVRQSL